MSALGPREAATLLHGAAGVIEAEMAGLPAAARAWHPRPGEWCVQDIVGHLIEAEHRGFAGRIRTLLDADDPELPPWDQEAVARARGDCGRPWATLLEEFSRVRAESVTLVAALRPQDLTRTGRHPTVGTLRVVDLLHEWIHHDREHIRQMFANIQAFVWPHMGNAQRFTTG